jgi:putative transcriptional regulator
MMKKLVAGLAVALGATFLPAAHAQAPAAASDDDAVFLVATPRLVDPAYRQTVLLVVPADNDRHIGFIINRPTQRTLSSLFPEHEPSKKVADPVFFGGPMSRSALFAVVKSEQNPGGGSIGLMKDLFFCMRVDVVDRIIETMPNDARYYVGYVEWRPGELRTELNRGLWYVMNANKDAVFRKNSESMWEEMQRMARAISADAAPLIRIERTPMDSLVAMLR